MKIGKLVQRHIPAIFDYCETKDPSEFSRLQNPQYSKDTFGINYPFCQPVANIGTQKPDRYYEHVYTVFDVSLRVTNDWYVKSLPLLKNYLRKHGIPFDDSPNLMSSSPQPTTANERKVRGRYKSPALGDGQNPVIRYILGQLGDKQFGASQWEQVKADFGHRCAYCHADGKLQMDHIIPINRSALGEHRLGNLVPACQSCNSQKGSKDFRDFLKESPVRIAAIEAQMAKHDYTPIGDHKALKAILEMAHADIRQLADRYITVIDATLLGERNQDSP